MRFEHLIACKVERLTATQIQRIAREEDRTQSAVIRRLLSEALAARQQGSRVET